MSEQGFVLDTPDGIEYYRQCAIRAGLALEIKLVGRGMSPVSSPTRGRALSAAKRELAQHGLKVRTRRQALEALHKLDPRFSGETTIEALEKE